VDLHLPTAGLDRYKSASQRAPRWHRILGGHELLLPCLRITASPVRTARHRRDRLRLPLLRFPVSTKSQSRPFGSKIVDAAYSEMKRAILEDRTPNLFVLHYDLDTWAVRTVLLVPHFAFTLSTLEKRPPLAPTARRAGWVGCNILLDKIPVHARISVVNQGTPQTSQQVRASYNRLRPLEKLQVERRGWTLDVLQVVQSLGKLEFTLADVYAHAGALAKLHPNNAHVRDKIRQQLQVLRDLGLLEFLGGGDYRLR